MTDWVAWHERYDGDLAERLAAVQRLLRTVLPGAARVLSLCAGDGRDVLPLLPAAATARLIELDPELGARARSRGRGEVVQADAGLTDAYVGAVPADVVVVCGVFGNVADEDVRRTVAALPQLCRQGGAVVWTRHRRDPDLTPTIRRWLAETGFEERAFESPGPGSWSVGLHVSCVPAQPLRPGRRLFSFVR